MLLNIYEIASDMHTQLKSGMIQNIEEISNKLLKEVAYEQKEIIEYFLKAGIVLEVEQ